VNYGTRKSRTIALEDLKKGAKAGWESTSDMIANVGRASRLGERSRGALDADATSYLISTTMADTIITLMASKDI
jgi:dihydroxyacetone kinase-like protein